MWKFVVWMCCNYCRYSFLLLACPRWTRNWWIAWCFRQQTINRSIVDCYSTAGKWRISGKLQHEVSPAPKWIWLCSVFTILVEFFFKAVIFRGWGDLEQNHASDLSSCKRMRIACLKFVLQPWWRVCAAALRIDIELYALHCSCSLTSAADFLSMLCVSIISLLFYFLKFFGLLGELVRC